MLHSAIGKAKSRFAAGLVRLLIETDGATAIEYGMIAAGVSIAILAAVLSIGGDLSSTFYGTIAGRLAR